MADSVSVECPKDQWTKVADSVYRGIVFVESSPNRNIRGVYKDTGLTAPVVRSEATTETKKGVISFSSGPEKKIDIYIWPDDVDIRVIYIDNITQFGGGTQIVEDFFKTLRLNKVDGYGSIDKFGAALSIAGDNTIQDVWELSKEYVFSTLSDIDTLSSSSVLDVGHLIKIIGIIDPSDDDESIGYSELNGQNKSLIYDNADLTGDPISFWRVYRMENEEKEESYGGHGSLTGVVYCFKNGDISEGIPINLDDVRATINDGNNQTLMAIYTIPPKKVGFLVKGEAGMEYEAAPAGPDVIRINYKSRKYEKVFKVKKVMTLTSSGNSIYIDERSVFDELPGLTDIKISKVFASSTMGISSSFVVVLVDERLFTEEYLSSIGQPGY